MPYKNPEDKKKYSKEYRKNNKEHIKDWRKNNKEYIKEYRQTEACIKSNRISDWKRQGMSLDYDFDEIYDIYIDCKVCDYCNVELVEGNYGSNRKCLDHNHSTGEIRGVLCMFCNIKDVLS